ncbi:hypothetical protein J4404_02300 [Candidatus Woesearchaeota archaeon]|nr:hypothetical protein [Candidatus Woesearchaeota archaeon]
MQNDKVYHNTSYVRNGGSIEKIELPKDHTKHILCGFEVNYINGIPVLTENGLVSLGFLKDRFIETKSEFKWLSDTNQIKISIRTGITKSQKDKVETNNEYSRIIYETLGGDKFINGDQNSGLLVNSCYKFELRNKEELNKFKNMSLELKLVGRHGTFPIVELLEEDINKMKSIKYDVAKLANNIFDLSDYLLTYYKDCVILKEAIINGNQNKVIGGN